LESCWYFSSSALIASTLGCSRRRKRALAEPNSTVMARSKRPRMLLMIPERTSQIRSKTSIVNSTNRRGRHARCERGRRVTEAALAVANGADHRR
jgi:hypothetical protein